MIRSGGGAESQTGKQDEVVVAVVVVQLWSFQLKEVCLLLLLLLHQLKEETKQTIQ